MVPNLKKILYVSDMSENSIPALEWALALAQRHDARITFLHVIEDVYPQKTLSARSYMGEEKWQAMSEDLHAESNAEIKERIHRFCDNILNEMPSCPLVMNDIIINRGVPVDEILREAESNGCDMITMGTQGAGVFKGNTARRLLRRSKIPVFMIPRPEKKA